MSKVPCDFFVIFLCDLNTYVASVSYMYSLYMYLISFQGNMHVNIQKTKPPSSLNACPLLMN